MCPEIYCGPSLRRRGSLRKSSHTSKYAPVFGSPHSLQLGLLATISGHILTHACRIPGLRMIVNAIDYWPEGYAAAPRYDFQLAIW